jgi:membrane-associated phospholipid phosphatase
MIRLLREERDDAVELLRGARDVARDHRRAIWIALGVMAILTVSAVAFVDAPAYRWSVEARNDAAFRVAEIWRSWGSFNDTLFWFGFLTLLGGIARRRSLRRAGLACLLAGVVAGLAVNVSRFSTGRPRANAGLPDGLYGPSLESALQSFPSGHSTASFAHATALAVALPAAGVPAVISAAGVAASSYYRTVHHVSDVLCGSIFGSLFGLCFGAAARRLGRRESRGETQG